MLRQALNRASTCLRPAGRRNHTYVASIDQGTSSSRVVLYDADTLEPVPGGHHQIDLSTSYTTPHPGWAQLDPKAILASVEGSAAGALQKIGASASQVVGVGITNQRETIVVWDRRTGEPLCDAVLWLDTRTRETADQLTQELGGQDALRALCGLPISTYFTGVKLRWLIDHVPGVKAGLEQGTAMVGTVDSWLTFKMTGRHATDVTNASRTMLMDIGSCAWSAECSKMLGVEIAASALPEIVSCAEPIGEITSGSFAGCSITASIGDQQSAMVGQQCFAPGEAKTTYGTGAFTLMNTGAKTVASTHGLLTTALYKLGSAGETVYALEGSVGSCGVGLNWFADKLQMFDSAKHMSALAAETTDSEGVYFVPAFGGILAPRWRSDAKGTLVGLTLAHDRSHVARAALEGIAFSVMEVSEAMVADSEVALAEMRVDGGGAMSAPLLQAQADLLRVKVSRPQNVETTALGAARMAAVGAGVKHELEVLPSLAQTNTVFEPEMEERTHKQRCANWDRAVGASLAFGTASD